MTGILLTILKIIGVLLLVLICILLGILLIILLDPIKYKAEGEKFQNISVSGKARWLFGLIEAGGGYVKKGEPSDGIFYYVRIAWIRLIDSRKETDASTEEKGEAFNLPDDDEDLLDEEESPSDIPVSESQKTDPEADSNPSEENMPDGNETETSGESIDDQADEPESSEPESDRDQQEKRRKPRKSLKQRFHKLMGDLLVKADKALKIPDKISRKLNELAGTYKKLSRKKDHLLAIWNNPENQKWILKTFYGMKRELIRILPKVDYLNLHFGAGDPALTGELLGGLSVLYAFYGDRMKVDPDFENTVFEGNFRISGKIILLPLAIFAVKQFLNKRFFHILKQIKRI